MLVRHHDPLLFRREAFGEIKGQNHARGKGTDQGRADVAASGMEDRPIFANLCPERAKIFQETALTADQDRRPGHGTEAPKQQ